jgi:DNA-binding MarR family transcriptional regulator
VLRQIVLPVAEIAGMKPTHIHVLVGLLSFADRSGRCWPSLRRIAEVVGMSLSRVQRAIIEMEKAGHLTRRRRFGNSCVYRLARRFLATFQKRNTKTPALPPRSTDAAQPACSASGTEGVAKKERQLELKEEVGSVRRSAPPPSPNPFARKAWLQRLSSFIGERLNGEAQWQGWELISAAQMGALDRGQQRQLDWLDRQMRACGYRPSRV